MYCRNYCNYCSFYTLNFVLSRSFKVIAKSDCHVLALPFQFSECFDADLNSKRIGWNKLSKIKRNKVINYTSSLELVALVFLFCELTLCLLLIIVDCRVDCLATLKLRLLRPS